MNMCFVSCLPFYGLMEMFDKEIYLYSILSETFRNWRYDLVIKCLLSWQRIWVQFLTLKSGDSHTPVTPAPGYPISSCGFHRHCNHVHTHEGSQTAVLQFQEKEAFWKGKIMSQRCKVSKQVTSINRLLHELFYLVLRNKCQDPHSSSWTILN